MYSTFLIIKVFCMELGIFMREHFNGMYRTDTYFLTRLMAELPVQIVSPIISTSIFYWMVGMNPDFSRFLMCCVINILLVQVYFAIIRAEATRHLHSLHTNIPTYIELTHIFNPYRLWLVLDT